MTHQYLAIAGILLGASLCLAPQAHAESSTASISFTGTVSPGCRLETTATGSPNLLCNTGAQIFLTPLDENGIAAENEIDRLVTNGDNQPILAANFPNDNRRKLNKLLAKNYFSAQSHPQVEQAIAVIVPF